MNKKLVSVQKDRHGRNYSINKCGLTTIRHEETMIVFLSQADIKKIMYGYYTIENLEKTTTRDDLVLIGAEIAENWRNCANLYIGTDFLQSLSIRVLDEFVSVNEAEARIVEFVFLASLSNYVNLSSAYRENALLKLVRYYQETNIESAYDWAKFLPSHPDCVALLKQQEAEAAALEEAEIQIENGISAQQFFEISIPSAILTHLRNAVSKIWHRKDDLRLFIESAIGEGELIAQVWRSSFEMRKQDLISDLFSRLREKPDGGHASLLALMKATVECHSFEHLRGWDSFPCLEYDAKEAVRILRQSIETWQREQKEIVFKEEKLRIQTASMKTIQRARKMEEFREEFETLKMAVSPQNRGRNFNKFLYRLFEFSGLDPKPEVILGDEEVDGFFTCGGVDFLVEAKWQKRKRINKKVVAGLSNSVREAHKNALGLFVSVNGYSGGVKFEITASNNNLLLMTGEHLEAILKGEIELPTMLGEMRRYATYKRKILYPLEEMKADLLEGKGSPLEVA